MKITKIKMFLLLIFLIFISENSFSNDFLLKNNYNYENGISLPPVKSFKTKQGINVIYIKDELPQFTITLFVGYGRLYEESANAGIASLLSKTLSLCGSEKYPDNSLNTKIESLGGKISIQTDWEGIILNIQVLQEYAEEAVKILADLVQNPNFNEKNFTLAKSLVKESIKREKDSPFYYAYSRWREIVFQKKGYGARSTEKSIDKIKLTDLSGVWKKYVNSKNVTIGITSTIPLTKIRKYIEQDFSSFKKGEIYEYPSEIDLKILRDNSKKIFFIPRKIPQATIIMGSPAPGIKYSGKYALKVFNYILGGGSFNSRLMQEIRVKRGLAYSTGSVIRFRKNSGIFVIYAQVGTDKTVQGYNIIDSIIKSVREKGVSESEIKNSKTAIVNSYIFKYDTLDSILAEYLFFWYNNISENEIKEYPEKIKVVSKDDIKKALGKVLGNGIVTLVIGNPELKNKLEKIGEVVVLEE